MHSLSRRRHLRVACDSLVALGQATADGAVLFAKNSDRPAAECQPLLQVPRRRHAPDTRLRCTYIDIPQAGETARLIGSRPYWCWGFEHGLNEHGVAIGNHTVFSRDPLPGKGLIGMDLVRLGLERSRTAAEAIAVMTALLATYGQGGSGYGDKEWPYHNSFLVADRQAAFVLETSDRHWAVRRITAVGSLSNHLTIGSDWDALSDGAIEHAIEAGYWDEARDERFGFAEAYRDTSIVPEVVSSGRHRRTCELLEREKGHLDAGALQRVLRDHYGRPGPAAELSPAEEQYFSVCMHAEPVGTTTASMIARIPPDAAEPLTYWASFASPCVGAFIPLYVDGDIPESLTRGGGHPGGDSVWWQCKQVLELVERDWHRYGPPVRAAWDQFEATIAEHLHTARLSEQPAGARTAFMQATVGDFVRRLTELRASLAGSECRT